MDTSSGSLTVICSTYNSARWIEGYLANINQQILNYFDIIFVDANSDDGSLEIIKNFDFREGITKKIIECDDKIPIYEAWNRAIKEATTPYIINVNTDDRLYPAALIIYANYAQSVPNGDIFYGSCNVVSDEKHQVITGLFVWPDHDHNILLQQSYGGPFPLLKRSSVLEDGLFNPEYTISGDYEMWLRMSKLGRNFVKVAETVGSYYNNPEGVSTNRESEHWAEHVRQDAEIRVKYR